VAATSAPRPSLAHHAGAAQTLRGRTHARRARRTGRAVASKIAKRAARSREEETMATIITEECINCGACEPECPNKAIAQGDDFYVIDATLCTECVGFYGKEACAAVCPTDCCVPDPERVEDEGTLLARAQSLHPELTLPALSALTANLSRFRTEAST
jgi:ferredoxin